MSSFEKLGEALGEIPAGTSPFTALQEETLRHAQSEADLRAALDADAQLQEALRAALQIEAFRTALADDHEKLVALVGEAATPPDARRFAPSATPFTGGAEGSGRDSGQVVTTLPPAAEQDERLAMIARARASAGIEPDREARVESWLLGGMTWEQYAQLTVGEKGNLRDESLEAMTTDDGDKSHWKAILAREGEAVKTLDAVLEEAKVLVQKYPRSRIYSLGASPEWLIATAAMIDANPDRYAFIAFSNGWYSEERGRKPPGRAQVLAYRTYLEKLGLDPRAIISQKEPAVIVEIPFLDGNSLLSFAVGIFWEWAKELGVAEALKTKLVFHLFEWDGLSKDKFLPLLTQVFDHVHLRHPGETIHRLGHNNNESSLRLVPYHRLFESETGVPPKNWKPSRNAMLVRFRIMDYIATHHPKLVPMGSGHDPSTGLRAGSGQVIESTATPPPASASAEAMGSGSDPSTGLRAGSVPAPMRVPGAGNVESHLVARVTTRLISPLELKVFGEIVRMRPTTTVLPKDKTRLTAIYASMAEYMVERGLVKEAIQFLDEARGTLPETVPHREALLAEWKTKRTRWKRWSDQIADGEALFKETQEKERSRKKSKSARKYAEAAQTLAAVAREADREGLLFLVHQIMHAHYLEAAFEAALRVYQGEGSPFGPAEGGVGFVEEMQRLHHKSHEEMFWSPVGYDSIPNTVVAPEGVQIREEILLAQKLCGFRWGHDDDVRLLAETETVEVGGKRDEVRMLRILAMKQIAEEVGECRIALSQLSDDPRRVSEAKKHLDAAKLLMTTCFGKDPPDFLKTLVREMELYLAKLAGETGGQKGVGSGHDSGQVIESTATPPPAEAVEGAPVTPAPLPEAAQKTFSIFSLQNRTSPTAVANALEQTKDPLDLRELIHLAAPFLEIDPLNGEQFFVTLRSYCRAVQKKDRGQEWTSRQMLAHWISRTDPGHWGTILESAETGLAKTPETFPVVDEGDVKKAGETLRQIAMAAVEGNRDALKVLFETATGDKEAAGIAQFLLQYWPVLQRMGKTQDRLEVGKMAEALFQGENHHIIRGLLEGRLEPDARLARQIQALNNGVLQFIIDLDDKKRGKIPSWQSNPEANGLMHGFVNGIESFMYGATFLGEGRGISPITVALLTAKKGTNPFDLRTLVQTAVVRLALGAAAKQIKIEVNVAEGTIIPKERQDKFLIGLSELLQNAVKYADEKKTERWIRIAFDAGRGILTVADNGIGIADIEAALAGHRQARGKEGEESEGLPTVRRNFHETGIRVQLLSSHGQGTLFVLTLPSPTDESPPVDLPKDEIIAAAARDLPGPVQKLREELEEAAFGQKLASLVKNEYRAAWLQIVQKSADRDLDSRIQMLVTFHAWFTSLIDGIVVENREVNFLWHLSDDANADMGIALRLLHRRTGILEKWLKGKRILEPALTGILDRPEDFYETDFLKARLAAEKAFFARNGHFKVETLVVEVVALMTPEEQLGLTKQLFHEWDRWGEALVRAVAALPEGDIEGLTRLYRDWTRTNYALSDLVRPSDDTPVSSLIRELKSSMTQLPSGIGGLLHLSLIELREGRTTWEKVPKSFREALIYRGEGRTGERDYQVSQGRRELSQAMISWLWAYSPSTQGWEGSVWVLSYPKKSEQGPMSHSNLARSPWPPTPDSDLVLGTFLEVLGWTMTVTEADENFVVRVDFGTNVAPDEGQASGPASLLAELRRHGAPDRYIESVERAIEWTARGEAVLEGDAAVMAEATQWLESLDEPVFTLQHPELVGRVRYEMPDGQKMEFSLLDFDGLLVMIRFQNGRRATVYVIQPEHHKRAYQLIPPPEKNMVYRDPYRLTTIGFHMDEIGTWPGDVGADLPDTPDELDGPLDAWEFFVLGGGENRLRELGYEGPVPEPVPLGEHPEKKGLYFWKWSRPDHQPDPAFEERKRVGGETARLLDLLVNYDAPEEIKQAVFTILFKEATGEALSDGDREKLETASAWVDSVRLERADGLGYRFRKEAPPLLASQARGEVPTDDLLVVVFPTEVSPRDPIAASLHEQYVKGMSEATEAGVASVVIRERHWNGRALIPYATAMVASRMGEFAPQARTNRATFAGGSFYEGINRAVRSFAHTAFARGERVVTARLVADAIWTYEGYQTRVDGKDEPHARQISLKNLLGNLGGEEGVVKMIRRWLDWPMEDWLSLDARVVLFWNGKEYLVQEGNPRRTLKLELTDGFPFGKDPKARAMARMLRVFQAPVPRTTSSPVSVSTEDRIPTRPEKPGPPQHKPDPEGVPFGEGILGARTWTDALAMRRGFASPRATLTLPSLEGRGLRGGWPQQDHPLPNPPPSRGRGNSLCERVIYLAVERGLKKAAAIAARLSDAALASLANRERLEKVLVKTGYDWAKNGLGEWGRKIPASDLLLLGLAALARSDNEVALALQRISGQSTDAVVGAARGVPTSLAPVTIGLRGTLPINVGH